MTRKPVLDEAWQVKDDLAREAGYDVHRFFEIVHQWSQEHPHPGRVIRNADELGRELTDHPSVTVTPRE